MGWPDAAAFALRNLRGRGARSLLACLGVALGTALLVALLSLSAIADSRVVSQLSRGGPVAAIHVVDAAPDPTNLDSDTFKTAGQRDLNESALVGVRHLPHVSSVVPVLAATAVIVPCPALGASTPPAGSVPACRRVVDDYFATVVGTRFESPGDLPVTLLAGRLPSAGSLTEVNVGQGYLDKVGIDSKHPADALRSEIELAYPRLVPGSQPARFQGRWYRAQVVGVVAQTVADGDFLAPIEQTQIARDWALTGAASRDFPRPSSQYSGLVVLADSLSEVHSVRAAIAALGYATSAPEHLIASVQKYLHVVDIVLAGIAGVALLIATLGVANTLLASVRERWREIGVLKAIGAGDGDVLRWILIEAAALGLGGGLAGTAAGMGLTALVVLAVDGYLRDQGLPGLDLGGAPLGLLVAAPLATLCLALLAGALPALRASRLPPREALGGL